LKTLKKHLVIPDCHAHYQHNNTRASWIGQLIADVKPDVVVNIGDTWDMPSLSGYDKGKSAVGRTYRADVDAGLEFNERLWLPVKNAKKRLPKRVFCVGNHEERIGRAINQQPTLEGTISYDDLELDRYYDEVVHYAGSTPGCIEIDGISYAHYLVSGIGGRAVSGIHCGYSLLSKHHSSCVVGHNHLWNHHQETTRDGTRIVGLAAGCYMDYDLDWAGEMNRLYWNGITILNNVEDGQYDVQQVSIDALRKEYGKTGRHS
jgi:hypothetical protein